MANISPTEYPQKRGSGKKLSGKRKVKRKGVVFRWFSFFCGWIFFTLVMNFIAMPIYMNSGREIIAPDLRNKTPEEALNIARAYELFVVEDGRDFSNSYPENTVSLQIPSPGTILKPGRRIHVIISQGPRPLRIPNVVGKSPVQAELDIKAAGLEVIDKRWKPSDQYSRGIVADQYPSGDQDIPENTGVILFIANGRREANVVMPNLIDLSYHASLDTLAAYKFDIGKVNVQKEEAPQLLPDTVIDQHPDPGIPTNTSVEVDLVVSTSQ